MEAKVSVVVLPPSFRSRALAAAVVLSVAGLLQSCGSMSMGETNVHGIVVTESTLSAIKPGTSQAQVLDVLGTPSTTSTLDGQAFYYVSQTTARPVAFMAPHIVDRNVLAVYFDNGKVSRVANYSLKDGVVFDSITRTTPTAGGDLNFITQLARGMTAGIPGFGNN
jgi:outer membrane protein assembly factor BamE (lipoprotein component of BamABCDE complex)